MFSRPDEARADVRSSSSRVNSSRILAYFWSVSRSSSNRRPYDSSSSAGSSSASFPLRDRRPRGSPVPSSGQVTGRPPPHCVRRSTPYGASDRTQPLQPFPQDASREAYVGDRSQGDESRHDRRGRAAGPRAGFERADRHRGEGRDEANRGSGNLGCDLETQQLFPGCVLFRREQEPAPAEGPTADLEVPRGEVPAGTDDCSLRQEILLDLSQGVLGRLPLIPPVGHPKGPEPGSRFGAASPPRGEPAPQASGQPGHGLHEVQEPNHDSQGEERTSTLPTGADETGMTRADPGLRERYRNAEEPHGSEDGRGAPAEAQEEHRRQERDEQVPLRRQGRGPSGAAGPGEGLERRRSPNTLVDATPPGREVEGPPLSVEASYPAQLPGRVVPRGPFAL